MPEAPVWPCGHDLGLLAGVALTSFFGQYTLNRSFQLLAASHASAVNTLQVITSLQLLIWFCFRYQQERERGEGMSVSSKNVTL